MSTALIVLLLATGLSCFLIGVRLLSKFLAHSFSERAKVIISHYTRNLFLSILVGLILTIILDSSSAVIILTIVFINAGSLDFKKAMGIILGSNIGTTFSSQLLALDIYSYSWIGIIIGLGGSLAVKNQKWTIGFKAMLYLSVMFLGLFIMEQSVLPLRDSDVFKQWILTIEGKLNLGAILGGLITTILQSSGATVAIVIIMAKQNIITISIGISIMLGAELGTCFNTAIASIGGSRNAIKAAIFHAGFNLATIGIALILFDQFVSISILITKFIDIGSIIPNAHLIFNISGVIITIPFIGFIEKLFNKAIPN